MGPVAAGTDVVLAIDGGNSKTDVAVVAVDGRVVATRRGPGYSPHAHGLEASIAGIEDLARTALLEADLELPSPRIAHVAAFLAGVDLHREQAAMLAAVASRGWAPSVSVDNDTFALLRLGSDGDDGVAVVCGAGINCVARWEGRTVRFPSLGLISGDWGGGLQLGLSAMSAAARDADGRGPRTALTAAVLEHFDAPRVIDLIERLHFGDVPQTRLAELSPAVFALALDGDPVAAALIDRLADEVADYVVAALTELELTGAAVPVVLGGSILAARHEEFDERIRSRVLAVAPRTEFVQVSEPPILGAALLGLDAVGAADAAKERVRQALAPRERMERAAR
ncbi:BadF/BadG/BcrA/BcrD ATPase family protein [Leifsonia sp. F6_8S_P_1B]|uniref:BadF/BadG/BcrA/BcrD ATPase family protein n=1 Tax=Leifsonia williamsii TaxID=3035919 RepID=A0ABT8K9G3_9MICO|nr:BadF/BadG/BcrA/BcrD ATPase family protein [Leifsonia williamsii]MDN4614088.1 BadF/BadG/BcrA/BcrD ATPase family protein [Leifsonia williamsii]